MTTNRIKPYLDDLATAPYRPCSYDPLTIEEQHREAEMLYENAAMNLDDARDKLADAKHRHRLAFLLALTGLIAWTMALIEW